MDLKTTQLSGEPPLETQTYDGGPALIVHEQLATSTTPGERTTVTLGPFIRRTDTFISVTCAGMSNLTVAVTPPSTEGPTTNRCLSGSAAETYLRFPGEPGDEFSILITTDTATSWRAAVFEPPTE